MLMNSLVSCCTIKGGLLRFSAILAVLLLGFNFPLQGQQYMFQINDFRAFNETINLKGSSKIFEDRLRLTSDQPQQSGSCWYSEKQIDFSQGFETEFTFLISNDKSGVLQG